MLRRTCRDMPGLGLDPSGKSALKTVVVEGEEATVVAMAMEE
jgi:hypothetical protein